MSNSQEYAKQLKLFSTAPHPCSYLEGEEASTLFIDPEASIDQPTLTYLSERGFRRSGNFIYKPDCTHCNACISLRIPVKYFIPSRSEHRILKRNSDLDAFMTDDIFSDHYYRLYADYISTRHYDGDMYPPAREQFESFLNNAFGITQYVVFTYKEDVKMVAVIDRLTNAFSSVYTFFDPHDKTRSLGSYAILWQILKAKELGLDYIYLGYWVKKCPKMNYKIRFQPAEVFINRRWMTLKTMDPAKTPPKND